MEVNINLFHLDMLATTTNALACVRLSYIINILFLVHVSVTLVAIFREVHYKECWFPYHILIAQCSVVDCLEKVFRLVTVLFYVLFFIRYNSHRMFRLFL
jgi:hypothetical protein